MTKSHQTNICSMSASTLSRVKMYKTKSLNSFLAQLLLTEMSSVVIPPPMSAHSVNTECAINQVTFHPSCHQLALLLSDGSLVIVKKTTQEGKSSEFSIRRYAV